MCAVAVRLAKDWFSPHSLVGQGSLSLIYEATCGAETRLTNLRVIMSVVPGRGRPNPAEELLAAWYSMSQIDRYKNNGIPVLHARIGAGGATCIRLKNGTVSLPSNTRRTDSHFQVGNLLCATVWLPSSPCAICSRLCHSPSTSHASSRIGESPECVYVVVVDTRWLIT